MSFKIGDYVVVKEVFGPTINIKSYLSAYNLCVGCIGKITNVKEKWRYFGRLCRIYTVNFLDKYIDKSCEGGFDGSLWIGKELRKATKKEICFEEL